MCEHLIELERALIQKGIKETYRGQAWSENCNEWIYFDCILDFEKIKKRFNLPNFINFHSNDDVRSGLEQGLVCDKCKDAIIGIHSSSKENKEIFE